MVAAKCNTKGDMLSQRLSEAARILGHNLYLAPHFPALQSTKQACYSKLGETTQGLVTMGSKRRQTNPHITAMNKECRTSGYCFVL